MTDEQIILSHAETSKLSLKHLSGDEYEVYVAVKDDATSKARILATLRKELRKFGNIKVYAVGDWTTDRHSFYPAYTGYRNACYVMVRINITSIDRDNDGIRMWQVLGKALEERISDE